MQKEISQLEAINCWDEVDILDAKTRTIPRTWVFKIKHSPNSEIKKYKVHFCCRGDLQEDVFKSFAPVVSWTLVHLFLVLTVILGWATYSQNMGLQNQAFSQWQNQEIQSMLQLLWQSSGGCVQVIHSSGFLDFGSSLSCSDGYPWLGYLFP